MSYRQPSYKVIPLAEFAHDGPPVRVRDLMAITSLSQFTVVSDIRAGFLKAQRRQAHLKNSPYYIDRCEARRWLEAMGFKCRSVNKYPTK